MAFQSILGLLLAFLASIFGVAGPAPTPTTPTPTPTVTSPTPTATAPAPAFDPVGDWKTVGVSPAGSLTIEADSYVRWNDGCASLGTDSWTQTGNVVDPVGPAFGPPILCEPADRGFDGAAVETFVLTGPDSIDALDAGGAKLVSFERSTVDPTPTDPKPTFDPVGTWKTGGTPNLTQGTVVMTADGVYSFEDLCTTVKGTWTLDGDTITVKDSIREYKQPICPPVAQDVWALIVRMQFTGPDTVEAFSSRGDFIQPFTRQ